MTTSPLVGARSDRRGPVVGVVMPAATARGGAETMLLQLLRHSRGRGIAYRVAFLEDGPMAAEAADFGWPVRVFRAGHVRQGHRFAAAVCALARWMRAERLDGVLSWMLKAHLYVAPAAYMARAERRLAWFHHGKASAKSRWDRWAASLPAREVWCPSRHTAEAYRQFRPRQPVRVVYPCVDPLALPRAMSGRWPDKAECRAVLGLPADGEIIGMVARLERWKGCHTLIDAAAHLAERRPSARFFIVGGDHFSARGYREELTEQARSLGVGDRVVLTGHRADVAVWMRAFDALVVASTEEPFGMATLEGMAAGTPVVASASGGPMEVVEDRGNGRLFRPGDAAHLASTLNEVLGSHDVRRRIVGNGLATCARFSADRLAEEVAAALRELFGTEPARAAQALGARHA